MLYVFYICDSIWKNFVSLVNNSVIMPILYSLIKKLWLFIFLLHLNNTIRKITCSSKIASLKLHLTLLQKTYYSFRYKLHTLNFQRRKTIHFPESLIITNAVENDLSVFKLFWDDTITFRLIFGDKTYSDKIYLTLKNNSNSWNAHSHKRCQRPAWGN